MGDSPLPLCVLVVDGYPDAADTYQRLLAPAAKLVEDFPDQAEFRGYSWQAKGDLAFAWEAAGRRVSSISSLRWRLVRSQR